MGVLFAHGRRLLVPLVCTPTTHSRSINQRRRGGRGGEGAERGHGCESVTQQPTHQGVTLCLHKPRKRTNANEQRGRTNETYIGVCWGNKTDHTQTHTREMTQSGESFA